MGPPGLKSLGMRMRTLERRGWKDGEPRRGRRSRGEKMTAGDRVRKCTAEEQGQSLGQNERRQKKGPWRG